MKRFSWRNEHPVTRQLLSHVYGMPRSRRRPAAGLRRVLRVPELLEPRYLLATFVVNQVNDLPDFDLGDGVADSDAGTPGVQISLRSAIQNANLDAALDNIDFNIPGAGVQVISPTSFLPAITQPVMINGYTQSNAAPNTLAIGSDAAILIQLDGFSAGALARGLVISAGGSTIRGLSITRFGREGIFLQSSGSGSMILGNFIGVPPSGNADQGNGLAGVQIYDSPGNIIGGPAPGDRNILSGNNDVGVGVVGTNAINNVIAGNYIGTNAAGDGDVGNSFEGVTVTQFTTGGGIASHTTIGGSTPGMGNVISGNDDSGVTLIGSAAKFNKIQGNRIGTNAAGDQKLPNAFHGVSISFPGGSFGNMAASDNTIGGDDDDDGLLDGVVNVRNIISGNDRAGVAIFGTGADGNIVQGNYIGTDISGMHAIPNGNDGVRIGDQSLGAGPSVNSIGGPEPGAGNLISGNMDNGIEIAGAATSVNTIAGNLIGTTATGNAPRPNQRAGVLVDGAKETFIGGAEPGARNIISGNGAAGVRLNLATATGNAIEGNLIGVSKDGGLALPNQDGVLITNNASGNTIGGAILEVGNVIAHNARDGVRIESGTRNTVRLNSIDHNGGLGIDLNGDKETLNDQNDADAGANDSQNWPEILNFSSATAGIVSVRGFFEGKDNTAYDLDFYLNDASSSLGQGSQYLTTATLTPDSNGYLEFQFFIPLENPLGKFLTVTATDPEGNTSEFSHDADTDGLYDQWETSGGVDGNGDHLPDFVLSNANPRHKDIYVDVDVTGVIDPAGAIQDVINKFATAPALNVLNPDGNAGIALHVDVDPERIEPQTVVTIAQLEAVKQAKFGTQSERQNPSLLAAKQLTHRYLLFEDYNDSNLGYGGLYSNQAYVAMGPAIQVELAAGFMHELGHTLFLDHGGGDPINPKPNYHSVMNYMWTIRPLDAGPYRDSWRLDYSNRAFNTLNENQLVESAGIGGDPGVTTRIGPVDASHPGRQVDEAEPIDWNMDGDTDDIVMTGVNVNKLLADDGGDGVVLKSYDDWSNLLPNFRHSYDYRTQFGLELVDPAGGAELGRSEPSLSAEVLAKLNDFGFSNAAPRIAGLPDVFVNEHEKITFTVPASDPEGNALAFTLAPGAPQGVMINASTGLFAWQTGEAHGGGQYIVTVQVIDAGSGRMRARNYGIAVKETSADFDGDADVDGADFLAWQRGLGIASNALPSQGDADADGDVDRRDLNAWQSTFGAVDTQALAAEAVVAESSTATAADFTSLAALRLGVDHHRPISGLRTPRPAAAVASDTRAIAFAHWFNARNSEDDDFVDSTFASRKRTARVEDREISLEKSRTEKVFVGLSRISAAL